jgi:pyruvate carboxylase subunit B
VLGYFGKTPVPPDPEIVKISAEQLNLQPTTKTVLEINDADPKKALPAFKKMLTDKGLPLTDENVFIVAACLEKGIQFLEGKATVGVRKNVPEQVAAKADAPKSDACTVTVDGAAYAIRFAGDQAVVNGKAYAFSIKDGIAEAPAAAQPAAAAKPPAPAATAAAAVHIVAPVPGVILRIIAQPGQLIKAGEEILIMEAMKMEIPIKAPSAGTVASIDVKPAQKVNTGDLMARLS